jgi:phosphatidylglycerol---prolipoprotein diacylglyceryl transferase
MRPILFEVRGVPIPAYGATMVVLFVCGLLLLRQRVRPLGVEDRHMLDLATIAAGVILLWAGLGTVLALLRLAGPAHLNALPVLAIGAFAYLAYLRRQGLPAERVFDVIAPIAAFALAAQYGIGTLLAGTAFGTPTDLPWGISFPPGSPAYQIFGPTPLQPVQLYLGLSFLIIGVVASFVPLAPRPGQRALLTFIAIAVVYLTISPLRGNTSSFITGGRPRMSEIVALIMLLYCSLMAWRLRATRGAHP